MYNQHGIKEETEKIVKNWENNLNFKENNQFNAKYMFYTPESEVW